MRNKIMVLAALSFIVLGLSACSDSNTDISYAPDTESIVFSQSDFSVGKDDNILNVNVKASHEFTVYSDASWLEVSPTNSIGHEADLTISVSANNTAYQRIGTVVVWAGGSRNTVKITQEAGESADIKAPIDGYSLVWNDEFDGKTLGDSWSYEVQNAGWVNNELQNYITDNGVTEVSNGTLKINLKKENDKIESARIYANKSTGWKYGYIEANIKLPKGKGTWPAFWMMPVNYKSWPADGEIDIMEAVGYNPDVAVSTIHCNKYNNGGTSIESGNKTVSNSQTEFHKYGLEWTSSYIKFYVDDQLILNYANDGTGVDAWPFDNSFYIILNLAWGGSWGGQQGVDESALPATMEVDYVRVFQKK